MKHIITFILFVLSTISWGQTANWTERFEKANELILKEKFHEAITIFQDLEKENNTSPELLFNLGNAFYRTNDNVNAVYYYEKALKLTPNEKSIETNLGYARKNLIDDITIVKEYDNQDILHQTLGKLTPDQWSILATILAFTILLAFIVYYLNEKSSIKRISFVWMIVALLSLGASIYAAQFEEAYIGKEETAIIFAQETNLKEEAKNTSKTIKELHAGTKVYILEHNALWIKVRLDNQEIGWLEKASIKNI